MRGLPASRASTAVAVLAAIVAVLAVMFPGPGFGQTAFSHGGPPSDVYTRTHPGDICAELGFNTVTAMQQDFTLDVESNVLFYFTFELGALSAHETVNVEPGLDGIGAGNEWLLGGPANASTGIFGTGTSGTLMWSFDHVAPGDHDVEMFARVAGGDNPSADMNECAFTVFVIPVAD